MDERDYISLLFFTELFKNVSDDCSDAVRHSDKACIVGVDGIEGHIVLVGGNVEAHTVDEVNVPVALLPCLQVRAHYNVTAAEYKFIQVGKRPIVWTGDHYIGHVGVLFSDYLVKSVMSCLKMLGLGAL